MVNKLASLALLLFGAVIYQNALASDRGGEVSALLSQINEVSSPFIPKARTISVYEPSLDEALELYKERSGGKMLPYALDFSEDISQVNKNHMAFMLFSELFHDYANGAYLYKIPWFVYKTPKNLQLKATDLYYKEGPCAGLGYLEASLKGKCVLKISNDYGLLESSKDIFNNVDFSDLYEGSFKNSQGRILTYNLYRQLPKLLGLKTYADRKGFGNLLSSFDKHVFSIRQRRFVKENDKFSDIYTHCFKSDDCTLLEFRGDAAKKVTKSYEFNDTIDDFPIYVDLRPEGDVNFKLRNTLLSDSEFVNYKVYTELELAVLKDLGYNIYPSEFYGSSIYSSGSKYNLQQVVLNKGYFAWNSSNKLYTNDKVSITPFSVGTHVYGNYNAVRQQAPIASVGYGATGIRVDGSNNIVTLPRQGIIIENGESAHGMSVRYGSNNVLNIKGLIAANNKNGIAVSLSFANNMLSNEREYQGSYVRVRSNDFREGKLSLYKAQAQKLPKEIEGPLVSRVNISGTVLGKSAALLIGDSAWVEEINFLKRATVKGDIISKFEPYVEGSWIYIKLEHEKGDVLPGRFQYQLPSTFLSHNGNKLLLDKLNTDITFGGVTDDKGGPIHYSISGYERDPLAIIDINGNIKGKNLNLKMIGGVTTIKGDLDVNKIVVADASLHLNSQSNAGIKVNQLYLDNGAALNLANGKDNFFNVKKRTFISPDAIIKVDTDEEGHIKDSFVFEGAVAVATSSVHLEPCLSYSQIKHFNADPKALLDYISKFVINGTAQLSPYKLSVQVPSHIWYKSGMMGRRIKCTARGCRIGAFVGNRRSMFYERLPVWRICLSLVGCVVLAAASVFISRKVKVKVK